MRYTPEKLVSQYREMGEKVEWRLHEDLRRKVNSSYIERRDFSGLKSFYTDVFQISGITSEYLSAIHKIDFVKYEKELLASLAYALEKTNEIENVKAIYFEYEHEQANFFLCTSYKKDEDYFWASNFSDVIPAPEIEPECDLLDDNLLNWHFEIIIQYIDAIICYALANCIDKLKPTLPVAMAAHDYEIYYYN